MTIDVHAHYFPDELIDVASRLIDEDLARLTKARAPGAGLSARELVGQLDYAGIDTSVLSPAALMPFVDDLNDAVTAAREMNDIYADVVRTFPGRFAAFGVVPLPHIDAAMAEAARCLDDLGMVGIALGCSVAGRQLDDPSLERFWGDLDHRHARVFLHPVGMSDLSLRAYNLNWMVGAPFEDTLAALRLVLSGVTTRHAGIRFIVPHMGGTIPFLMARIDGAAATIARSSEVKIELPVSQHLQRLYYDTSNRNRHALRCAADTLGADSLVLGSDFPYSLDERLKENVTYISETLLDRDAADKILGATAAALLGLGPR
jgi:6-methylsalicylate decarboxylase